MATLEKVIKGKTYVVRRPTLGDQMRIMRMGVSSGDQAYFTSAVLAYSIDSIDGVPLPRCKNVDQIIEIADRIDDAVEELVQALEDWLNPVKVLEEIKTEAKNLPSTPSS